MSIIWATRGKNWGFRFLRDAESKDVMRIYDEAFSNVGSSIREFKVTPTSIAIRFPDPLERVDRAGRLIPHEFVLTGSDMTGIESLDAALNDLWPTFSDEYARIWDLPGN